MNVIKELPNNNNWRRREKTDYIVLHHAEAIKCTIWDIDKWHKQNGWNGGCGYNFFIRKDGSVYEGRPIDIIGAHCKGYNEISVGICFEGNFDEESPTQEQFNSGVELIRFLLTKYPRARVIRHRDLNSTACPGELFNDNIITEGMKKMEQKHWADDIFKELNDKGIKIQEKRFDEPITRAEVMAMIWQVVQWVLRK